MGRRPAKKSFFELNQKANVRGSDEKKENYSPDRNLGLLGKQTSGSSRKLNSPTFILSTMQVRVSFKEERRHCDNDDGDDLTDAT
jgi:hypothetical protein